MAEFKSVLPHTCGIGPVLRDCRERSTLCAVSASSRNEKPEFEMKKLLQSQEMASVSHR